MKVIDLNKVPKDYVRVGLKYFEEKLIFINRRLVEPVTNEYRQTLLKDASIVIRQLKYYKYHPFVRQQPKLVKEVKKMLESFLKVKERILKRIPTNEPLELGVASFLKDDKQIAARAKELIAQYKNRHNSLQ